MAKLKLRRAPVPATKAVQRVVGERWTPRLAKTGWTPICDYFLKNCRRLKVSPTEAMVIIQLMSFKWDAKAPFPSLKTIANRMGITATSVRSHIRNLEKRELLLRRMMVGTTNRFFLEPLFQKLEAMMDEDDVVAKAKAERIEEEEEEYAAV
jgi:DNA-binding MarR family transcriptional regulator